MGATHALPVAPATPPIAPDASGIPSINPVTGLSTDYLNHFNEAVMALEMVTVMPDCVPDLQAWQPKTYCEHFAHSRFSNRNRIIAAYWAADPKIREDLDEASETLNTVLQETRDAVLIQLATPVAGELAARAAAWLKPLIARTAAVINGTTGGPNQGRHCAQAAIDTLFGR